MTTLLDQLTPQELAHLRVRLVVAEQHGRVLRALPAPHPHDAQTQYLAFLLDVVAECERIVRDDVLARLPEFFENETTRLDARAKRAKDDVDEWLSNVDVKLVKVVPAARSRKAAAVVAGKVNAKNKAQNARQWKQALGIDLRGRDANVDKALKGFVRENVKLVRSIPQRLHKDLRDLVDRAHTKGMRVETLAKRIEERFDVSRSRARLIARDQIGKLNGQLTQTRQEAAGVTEYEWSTSEDERVRPDHARLDGTRQKWARPPVVDRASGRRAHPGGDYQCRCNGVALYGSMRTAAERSKSARKGARTRARNAKARATA